MGTRDIIKLIAVCLTCLLLIWGLTALILFIKT